MGPFLSEAGKEVLGGDMRSREEGSQNLAAVHFEMPIVTCPFAIWDKTLPWPVQSQELCPCPSSLLLRQGLLKSHLHGGELLRTVSSAAGCQGA